MATATDYIRLAQTLHPRLLRFFAKYPPGSAVSPVANPFTPTLAKSGKWHGARISLRVQAELCKLAREYGVEELLPHSKKSTVAREERRAVGKTMRGALAVKGHAWERNLAEKIEKRKVAMENMPMLIDKWKRAGHGRSWKDWPK